MAMRNVGSLLLSTLTLICLVSGPADAVGPPPRTVSIPADASVTEGNIGTTTVTFTIELSRLGAAASVDYQTQSGTATSGVDFVPVSGTINFDRGARARVEVVIVSDRRFELDETFSLQLSNPVNASIVRGTATATIANDDPNNLAVVVANSSVFVPRSDSCGNDVGRLCESLVGNVVADSMRTAFAGTFTIDFAIMDAGGLRNALTCPLTDIADFCPSYVPPPYPITYAQAYSVVPFGNRLLSVVITGAELKQMLENGVSQLPDPNGRFAQVAGFCFTYDAARTVGDRVLSVVRHTSGVCTTTAVDVTAGASYRIVITEFMARGGDFYPFFFDRAEAPYVLTDQDRLTDYLSEQPGMLISPSIEGRITTCTACTP